MDDAEDRGVRPYTERHDNRRHQGKARALQQQPARESKVLHQG
jgi:hypothetical protein